MRSDNLASWLASAPSGSVIHCDDDPGGQRAAADLRRVIRAAGGRCTAVLPAVDGAKDPAAAAASFPPLPSLPPEWRDYAVTLRDCNPTWAVWEVYRQAGVAFSVPEGWRVSMTSLDGILAGEELGATGQDHLSELRAWLRANPEDQLVRDELRRLASELGYHRRDRRPARGTGDHRYHRQLARSLLSVAGGNGAILTEGSVALLAGAGGVGKSALMVSLALGVARLGDGVRGAVVEGIFDGVGGPVILVTYEDVPEVTAWRMRNLVAEVMGRETEEARQEVFGRIYVIDLLGRPLFGPMSTPGRSASYNAPPGPLTGWSDLWLAAARIRPGLIIVDPALSAFSGESNAAAPVREFLGALSLRAKTLGTGVLLTAHSNKAARGGMQDPYDPGQVGGSAAWVGRRQGRSGHDPPSDGG